MSSFVARGNQYIQLVKVLYCKLPTISKQLPTFPHKVRVWTTDLRGGRGVSYHCATMASPCCSNWSPMPYISEEENEESGEETKVGEDYIMLDNWVHN